MQTKFDIGDVAYIPVRIRKMAIEGPNTISCSIIRVCPLEQSAAPPQLCMTYLETDLFSKEDIINGKMEEKINDN